MATFIIILLERRNGFPLPLEVNPQTEFGVGCFGESVHMYTMNECTANNKPN